MLSCWHAQPLDHCNDLVAASPCLTAREVTHEMTLQNPNFRFDEDVGSMLESFLTEQVSQAWVTVGSIAKHIAG
jgi:hypothetical protein